MLDSPVTFLRCLSQLWQKFRGQEKPPAFLGSSKDYNVDMVPKVLSPLPKYCQF
jgi:hypothetical protein